MARTVGWTPQHNSAVASFHAAAAAKRREARLRRRFEAASRHVGRAANLRRFRRRARLPALAAGGALAVALAVIACSPWPATVTLRHVVAISGCDAAYLVDLAPARRGGPGYWGRLDPDRDGRSCEIKPGLHRHNTLVRWYFWGQDPY